MSAPTPGQEWEALKVDILAKIEAIDNKTPWRENEPEWWLEMQAIYRSVKDTQV